MKNVGTECQEGGIIIFLRILASSLQLNPGMQLALVTLGSAITHCPKGAAGPYLQGYFYIHAVPSLYQSTVPDTSGAKHWISLFWPSWKFCRSNCTFKCLLSFYFSLQRVHFSPSPWSLMMPLSGIITLVSLEEIFVASVHLEFLLWTSTFSVWWFSFSLTSTRLCSFITRMLRVEHIKTLMSYLPALSAPALCKLYVPMTLS